MAGKPVIHLENVKKSYGSGGARTPVLRGVSFDVAEGELLAMVGQSGSGKSTLLNIIGGLDEPDSGHVEIFGRPYSSTPERELAALRNRNIGFVFQHFNLLDHLDCVGNVVLPAKFGGEFSTAAEISSRGMECLERVGLADLARRRPSELSGGQKQRIAIARALFNRPALLLCDEPTGNLDTRTGRDVINFFRELNATDGVTLLIVTHEKRVAVVAKRIIRVEDGRLIEGEDISEWIDDAAQELDDETDDAATSSAERRAGGEA